MNTKQTLKAVMKAERLVNKARVAASRLVRCDISEFDFVMSIQEIRLPLMHAITCLVMNAPLDTVQARFGVKYEVKK